MAQRKTRQGCLGGSLDVVNCNQVLRMKNSAQTRFELEMAYRHQVSDPKT